jgi:calcium-dependent protein kinase
LKIGQGAFAIVRRAQHKETKAWVALKTYEKKYLMNPKAADAVQSEINTLSDLQNHPYIMRLHEVIDQRTQVHLVMELCQGMPL